MKPHALLAAALLLAACAGPSLNPPTAAEARYRQAVAQCLAAGGVVATEGLASTPVCRRKYTDGGKVCSDNSQCEGNCTFEGAPPHGTPVTGRCEAVEESWGCSHEVRAGRAFYGVCAD